MAILFDPDRPDIDEETGKFASDIKKSPKNYHQLAMLHRYN